jgi:hypothetical protein
LLLRFNTCEVTLSGFAGGEYSPLPASKGLAFPEACSPSKGTPLLRQITLRNNRVPQKTRKLRDIFLEENPAGGGCSLDKVKREGRVSIGGLTKNLG